MPWLFDFLMSGILSKGWISRDRRCRGTWKVSDYTKGVTGFPEGQSRSEWKTMDIFVLVINISR